MQTEAGSFNLTPEVLPYVSKQKQTNKHPRSGKGWSYISQQAAVCEPMCGKGPWGKTISPVRSAANERPVNQVLLATQRYQI